MPAHEARWPEEVDGFGQNRLETLVKWSVNFRGRAGNRLV
jgi:hypothetical protein